MVERNGTGKFPREVMDCFALLPMVVLLVLLKHHLNLILFPIAWTSRCAETRG